MKQAHQQSQTVPESAAVLVDDTLPVQRHQESGRLDRDECVVSQIGSLFAECQRATHLCNLLEGVVLQTMEHDTNQKGTLPNNSTGAPFIKSTLPVHTQSGDILSTPPSRDLNCKKMPYKHCAAQQNSSTIQRCTLRHTEVLLIDHHGEPFHACGQELHKRAK